MSGGSKRKKKSTLDSSRASTGKKKKHRNPTQYEYPPITPGWAVACSLMSAIARSLHSPVDDRAGDETYDDFAKNNPTDTMPVLLITPNAKKEESK